MYTVQCTGPTLWKMWKQCFESDECLDLILCLLQFENSLRSCQMLYGLPVNTYILQNIIHHGVWCMMGFWHWHIPTFIITDISPPWWDFVRVGICWVTMIIINIIMVADLPWCNRSQICILLVYNWVNDQIVNYDHSIMMIYIYISSVLNSHHSPSTSESGALSSPSWLVASCQVARLPGQVASCQVRLPGHWPEVRLPYHPTFCALIDS